MVKISVIVPIYNVEKQLNRCIESLLKQKIQQIQIILVNDGSTDNSGKIAQEYAKKFPDKILYLEKENGGLSDARNYGIAHATGEYLTFVDSDDYISDNLYEDLEKYLEQDYDMIKFKIEKVDENGNKILENYTPVFADKTGEEAFEILYKSDELTEVAWGYVYKRKMWIENNFKFAKGMFHEDFGLIPLVILKANKVASTNIMGYYYVQTSSSITRGKPETIYIRAEDLLKHYDNMIETIKGYNISNESRENIKIYYTNCILLNVNNLDKKDKNKYIKEIKKRKMTENIKARNFKRLLKKIILRINIKLYLKIR
jgi:glycosyltransferase involved in cell wall biosynthesis